MTPLFIELSDGTLVNANHVMRVVPSGPNGCVVETNIMKNYIRGEWQPGGMGSMHANHDTPVAFTTNYSVQEWATRVNNAIALAQAVERMAK
jgi:hypothetical protein